MNLKQRLAELAGIEQDPVKAMGDEMCPKCNSHPCECEPTDVAADASVDPEAATDVPSDIEPEMADAAGGDVFPLAVVSMGDGENKTPINDFAALVDFIRQIPEDTDLSQYSLVAGDPVEEPADDQVEDEIPSDDLGDEVSDEPAMSSSGEETDVVPAGPVKKMESVKESTTPKSSVKNKKPEITTWNAGPEAKGSGSSGKSSVHNKVQTVDDGVASDIKSKEAAKPAAKGGGLDSSSSGKSSVNNKKETVKTVKSAKPEGGSGEVPKTTPKPSVKPKKVEVKDEIVVPSHQGKPGDTTDKSTVDVKGPEVKGSSDVTADKSHTPSYNPKDPKVGDLDTTAASGKQPAKVPASSAKQPAVKVGDFTKGPDADPVDSVKSKIPAEVMSKLNAAIDNAKKAFDDSISKATLDSTESIPGSGERDRFSTVLGTLNKVKDLLSQKDEDAVKSAGAFVTSLPNHIRKEIPVEVNLFIGKAISPLSLSDKFKEIKASRAKSKGM